MAKIVAALYLLLMLIAGWRLFGMRWPRGRKAVAGIALVCPLPLVLLLPPLIHPDRPFADLLRAIGLTLLLCGALCLLGGMSAAWLRARKS
jgi:hypothetical protein